MKEYYISDDGIRLHAKLEMPPERTKCPILIIFHGITGHMEERHMLAAAQTALDAGMAALRVELYGHGESEGRFEDHTFFKWISNGLAVLDHVKTLDFVTDVYVCGHSQGGMLAMYCAKIRSRDIRGLIPLSPALVIPDAVSRGTLLDASFDPLCIPETVDVKGRKLKGDYFHVAQLLHTEDLYRDYRGPVLLIHADADEAVPVQYSVDASHRYENCELVIIPGDSHNYQYHLEMVTEAMRKFLLKQTFGTEDGSV